VSSYIGTKIINAKPMNRADYNDLWTNIAAGIENRPIEDGYLVEYLDGGTPNHPGYAGYISWSPKDVFERSYRPTTGLTFGMAIEALKSGKRVARSGWNGKGMWLHLIPSSHWETTRGLELLDSLPWIGMKTVDDKFVPWLASQTDVLAEDWTVVE
jgi:hypothetical protein